MPKMNGDEACQQLRADDRTREIPVILLSGTPQAEVWQRCREAGVSQMLMKPYEPQQLLKAIQSALDEKGKP